MFKKRGCFVVIVLLVLILGSFMVSGAIPGKVYHENWNNILINIGHSNMTLQSFVRYNVSLNLIDQTGKYDRLNDNLGNLIRYANCAEESRIICAIHPVNGWYNPSDILITQTNNCGTCPSSSVPTYQDTGCLGLGGSDWYDCNSNKIVSGDCNKMGFDNTPSFCGTRNIKGWYNDNNELIAQDQNCNIGFLGFGANRASCTLGTSYNNTVSSMEHNASQIWVSVRDGQMTLAQALKSTNLLCNASGAARVLSIPTGNSILIGKYHLANETEVKIGTSTMSLQEAINKNKLCYNYELIISSDWGACSETCEWGLQYKAYSCKRTEDGATVTNSYCGAAPTGTSRGCNPQACVWKVTQDNNCQGQDSNRACGNTWGLMYCPGGNWPGGTECPSRGQGTGCWVYQGSGCTYEWAHAITNCGICGYGNFCGCTIAETESCYNGARAAYFRCA